MHIRPLRAESDSSGAQRKTNFDSIKYVNFVLVGPQMMRWDIIGSICRITWGSHHSNRDVFAIIWNPLVQTHVNIVGHDLLCS